MAMLNNQRVTSVIAVTVVIQIKLKLNAPHSPLYNLDKCGINPTINLQVWRAGMQPISGDIEDGLRILAYILRR